MRHTAGFQSHSAHLWLAGVLAIGCLAFSGNALAQTDSDRAVDNLAQTAANAQQAKDFETALDAWGELLAKHPQSKHRSNAFLYSGICNAQLQRHADAIKQLEQALETLDPTAVESLAKAHLFLGHSQLEFGKVQSRAGKKEESQQLFTTATQTFERQLKRFPKFSDNDQAAFFQGAAYEQLGRLDKAAESYTKMLAYPQPAFRFGGLFALANVNEQLGKYDEALTLYRQYLKEGADQPDVNEVRYRTGETLWQLAAAARTRGDQKEFETFTGEAMGILSLATDEPAFGLRDEALFRQGLIASQLGDHEKSAKLFAQVTSIKGSPRASQAALFAGREWLQAGNHQEAESSLKQAIDRNDKFTAEAVHWFAQSLLQTGKATEASTLVEKFLPSAAGNPFEMDLMMDRAESAWRQTGNPELRAQVPALFLAVADRDPKHVLAPAALYNATFAHLESSEHALAIEMATRFAKEHPTSDFLPDVLEVQADALIGLSRADEAVPILKRLTKDFSKHPKHAAWQVREGLAFYLAGQYDEATKSLQPIASTIVDQKLAAEAFHWLGASLLKQKQTDAAIEALGKSREASPDWRRAADTLSLLSQAQSTMGRSSDAEKTLAELKAKFPDNGAAADAELRLAKQAFQTGEFDRALAIYDRLLDSPSGEIAPHALYDSAWCLAKLSKDATDKKLQLAVDRFGKLIADYPEHALCSLSLLGRAAAWRQIGNSPNAVADLDQFLKNYSQHDRVVDARYERGLALADSKKWLAAIAEWESLLTNDAAAALADRLHYELAWAYRALDDAAKSTVHFQAIAEKHATSPIAGDAFFQLGELAYANKDYDSAAGLYQRCLATKTTDSLREKAAYKLGFAYFRNKKFDDSLAAFQEQTKMFPGGPLSADGLFMVGESLFENKKFGPALEAYRVAKPAIDATDAVKPENKWLALLHGSQSALSEKKFADALDLARQLAEDEQADQGLRLDAWLEVGNAHQQLKKLDLAIAAWTKATDSPDKTGARAYCMLGDALFAQQKFDEAIKLFKRVIFGFGGEQVDTEIDPWQAYAAYEIARCHFVQVNEADDKLKPKLIEESINAFEYLIEKYPNDPVSKQAKDELKKLKSLKTR